MEEFSTTRGERLLRVSQSPLADSFAVRAGLSIFIVGQAPSCICLEFFGDQIGNRVR